MQNNSIKTKCPYCLADSLILNEQTIVCGKCGLVFSFEKKIPVLFTTKKFPIVLVGGRSDVGKTHLINQVVSKSDRFNRPTSFTTRKKREDEHNEEYIFVSQSEFEEIANSELLINIDIVYGNSYGITFGSVISNSLADIISIKEVHPRNFYKFNKRNIQPITVLITDEFESSEESKRSQEDYIFYQKLDESKFDIVFDKSITDKPELAISTILDKIVELSNFQNTEQINREGYNKIASEFYDNKRITTANFHHLTDDFFNSQITKIDIDKVVLDLGCGTGYITEIIRRKKQDIEIVVCDLSVSMLEEIQKNQSDIIPICCSAFNTPFEKNTFDLIFSSLCDPFCNQQLFDEVNRILKISGKYIFSIPSDIWANGLRTENKNMTEFVLSEIGTVKVLSFTYSSIVICEMIKKAGLEIVEQETKFGKDLLGRQSSISPAITKSAENLGIGIEDLPIINLFQAVKTSVRTYE